MSGLHVIITVPHAVGRTVPLFDHDYDIIAGSMALLLSDAMSVSHEVILGDTDRDTLDLNRRKSRSSAFRSGVRSSIARCREYGNVPFLLDVHSYPRGNHKYGHFLVCLLGSHGVGVGHRELLRHLREAGFHAGSFGFEVADIVAETSAMGVDGVLLEVNEGANTGERWLLACSIAAFFLGFT